MAAPAWYARLTDQQKRAVLAAQSATELIDYLRSQGVELPEATAVELLGAVNLGRGFGVWLKRMLEDDKNERGTGSTR